LLNELPKAEADILQKFFHKRARSLHCVMQHGRALDSGNFARALIPQAASALN